MTSFRQPPLWLALPLLAASVIALVVRLSSESPAVHVWAHGVVVGAMVGIFLVQAFMNRREHRGFAIFFTVVALLNVAAFALRFLPV